MKERKETITTREFYYPQTGKWYRYIDKRINGNLLSRVCQEIKETAGSAVK